MLTDDTEKLLADLQKANYIKQLNKQKKMLLLKLIIKIIFYIVAIICLFCILFYPVQSGEIIGNWINNFFGTIYKNIIK